VRRIACLFVPCFPVVAAIRAEPALAGQPLVILSDTAPARVVVDAAESARAQGIHPGMPEGQLLAEPRSVICRVRVANLETAAHHALLEVALEHSPRVEDGGHGIVYLDVAGLGGLFGDEGQIGQRLHAVAATRGLAAQVGIAGTRAGALLAGRWTRDVTVIPPGREPLMLAGAPLALLDLPAETADRFARWGLRTLGDLAALPSGSLFERLGEEGLVLQRAARGEDPRPLRPWQPPALLEEVQEIDGGVDTLEPVHAVLGSLVERICERLASRERVADRLEWICRLADGSEHGGQVAPAFPTRDAPAVSALLRAALEARPPRASVTGVLARAWPIHLPPSQEHLDTPARPSSRRLAETLARLAALVGAESLGIPAVVDTHRPDAIRVEAFTSPTPTRSRPRPRSAREPETASAGLPAGTRGDAGTGEELRSGEEGEMRQSVQSCSESTWTLALRRLRPPRRAAVTLVGGRPVHLRAEGCTGQIVASAGPWRSSGEWWTDSRWVRDEWDVELLDGTLCRLATDGRGWSVEAIYD
jgi:protein ImuB